MPERINSYRVELVPLRPTPKYKIRSPVDVVDVVKEMEDYDREYVKIISLDIKNQLIGIETISIGSLTAAIVHQREAVTGALLDKSYSVILVHNHPSGICTPSKEDFELHTKLTDAFKLLGIPLLDSIIVGKGCYYSFAEHGFVSVSEVERSSLAAEPPKNPVPHTLPKFHGKLYFQYKQRISEITTISQIDEISNEIFDIIEKQEFDKLKIDDITEIREELRKLYASIQRPPPTPTLPPPLRPPIHGSAYPHYKKRISEALNTSELDKIYSEIYSILEKEEIDTLSDRDISELEGDIRVKREEILKRVEKLKAAPPKKIAGLPPLKREPEYMPSVPLTEEVGDFLFAFNKVPGDDSDRFIDVISKKYKINWLRKEYIKKTAPNQISVVAPQGTLSLTYHKDLGRVVMIYDTKSAEFLAIQQDSNINIYSRKRAAVVARREEILRAEVARRGYKYTTPKCVTDSFMGRTYIRDLELEQVIRFNNLFWFSTKDLEKWFIMDSIGKKTLYHYDIGGAFRRRVDTEHQYTWESLEKKYGIPKEYIDKWKSGQ